MKEFYVPEDFIFSVHPELPSDMFLQKTAANIANAKLKRDAKVVYGTCYESKKGWAFDQQGIIQGETTHTALLVCIEPIAKCEHSAEKIIDRRLDFSVSTKHITNIEYQCECGAKVKPSVFTEIK